VLNKGSSKPYLDHNAEDFVYKNIRVIVNYDEPWLSTAYEIRS
jgi:hypothetical protein